MFIMPDVRPSAFRPSAFTSHRRKLLETKVAHALMRAVSRLSRHFRPRPRFPHASPEVSSLTASVNSLFFELGLTDAAIAEIALAHDRTVLTDDLPLYLWLMTIKVSTFNFTHLRERLVAF
jgi:hypothetical protein